MNMTKKFKMDFINKRDVGVFNETGGVVGCEITVSLFAELYSRLKKELGREPTANDLDKCPYIPSSKLLQRYFKDGVVGFRRFIGAEVADLSKGVTRVKKMKDILNYSSEKIDLFKEVYNTLNHGTDVIVLRKYCYQQWIDSNRLNYFHGNFADMAIIKEDHVQLFDFINSVSLESLAGSVRIMIDKLKKQPVAFRPEVSYEFFFVCLNRDISQKMIDKVPICNKEIKVYSIITFRTKFL